MINKDNLDKRICDVVAGATNEQTYRDFIRESEDTFNLNFKELDFMTNKELEDYLNYLDKLWDK